MRRVPVTVLSVLAGLLAVTAPGVQARAAADVFRLVDPQGDDHGAGQLMYPDRGDLFVGDMDLLALSAKHSKKGTWFTVRFRNPVRDPAGEVTELGQEPLADIARHGFYTLNVDVYIDQDREPGSGNTGVLPGRGVSIDNRYAWEKAVILTPMPRVARARLEHELEVTLDEDKARAGPAGSEAHQSMEEAIEAIDARYFFPTRIRVSGREIRFYVPNDFLGAPASADWAYAALVTGSDPERSVRAPSRGLANARLMAIPLSHGRTYDRFGLPKGADPAQPPVIDMLNPLSDQQAIILSDYDTYTERLVAVPGIVPSAGEASWRAAARRAPSAPASTAGSAYSQPPPPASAPPAVTPPASAPPVVTPPAPSRAMTSQPGVAALPSPAAPSRAQRRTLVERLRTVNDLKNSGLISEDEYQEIRRKILAEI